MKSVSGVLAACVAGFVLCGAAAPAAVVIKVKAGESIQSAINGAPSGATIEVGSGVYMENVSVVTDELTLKGKGATIDGTYSGPCISVDANDVTIMGFRLINGDAGVLAGPGFDDGTNSADRITVKRNLIIACRSDGGIVVQGDDAVIDDNTLVACGGVGIWYRSNNPGSHTKITKNDVSRTDDNGNGGGQGINSGGPGTFQIDENTCQFNELSGIYVEGAQQSFALGEEASIPSSISRNKCTNNGGDIDDGHPANGDGIHYTEAGVFLGLGEGMSFSVVIEKNVSEYNADDGIHVEGMYLLVKDNRCTFNNDDGLEAGVNSSELRKNTLRANADDGLTSYDFSGFGDGGSGGNLYVENICRDNFDDGLETDVSGSTIDDNQVSNNVQNGIKIDGGSSIDVTNNATNKNGHQGISNDGASTDFIANKSKDNYGPDIAGLGDGGSVGTFAANNNFGTGGPGTADVYD